MHDEPGRLVDDDQLVVLEQDVERDVLAHRFGRLGLGQNDRDRVTFSDLALGLVHRRAGNADRTLLDEGLDAAARQFGSELQGQPLIESLAGGTGVRPQHYQSRIVFVMSAHSGILTGLEMNMASPLRSDDEEKPLDPAVENVRRKLLRFMLVNLGLLGVALIAVVGAIVYKSRTATPETPAVPVLAAPADGGVVEGLIELPIGSKIVSQSLSGDRVSIYVEEADGARSLHIYDLAAKRMVGRFNLVGTN